MRGNGKGREAPHILNETPAICRLIALSTCLITLSNGVGTYQPWNSWGLIVGLILFIICSDSVLIRPKVVPNIIMTGTFIGMPVGASPPLRFGV